MMLNSLLKNYEMIHSYSRKGTPYDNAPIETFHSEEEDILSNFSKKQQLKQQHKCY